MRNVKYKIDSVAEVITVFFAEYGKRKKVNFQNSNFNQFKMSIMKNLLESVNNNVNCFNTSKSKGDVWYGFIDSLKAGNFPIAAMPNSVSFLIDEYFDSCQIIIDNHSIGIIEFYDDDICYNVYSYGKVNPNIPVGFDLHSLLDVVEYYERNQNNKKKNAREFNF